MSPHDRIRKEVLDSQCFDRCRAHIAHYDEYLANKIEPIVGDIVRVKIHFELWIAICMLFSILSMP